MFPNLSSETEISALLVVLETTGGDTFGKVQNVLSLHTLIRDVGGNRVEGGSIEVGSSIIGQPEEVSSLTGRGAKELDGFVAFGVQSN